MTLEDKRVAVNFSGIGEYFKEPPFHPSERYPEYDGEEVQPGNKIYANIREVLHLAGLDEGNFGSASWNPLGDLIDPGMTVFIKPNTVRHYHMGGGDPLSIINHASVLRPVLDYTIKALNGRGRIIIGDSQVIFGRFDEAYEVAQIDQLLEWIRTQTEIEIECFDLRLVQGAKSWMYGRWAREKIEKDPRGYRFVNLGEKSCFKDIDPKRLRIAIANYKNMIKHHSNGKHEYLFPQSVLDSDVIINIPKLKTHRRTAVTLAIKNFMGIPAWKDTLPHFITGSSKEGGDQYIFPSIRKKLVLWLHDRIQSSPYIPFKFVLAIFKRILWDTRKIIPFKDNVSEAMWYGNDTLWRTLADLNRGVLYADRNGVIRDKPQRRYFAIVDGFIAGEKDGPVAVDPVPAGIVIAGYNPVAVDLVAASLMGFNVERIPMIWNMFGGRDGLDGNAPNLYWGNESQISVRNGGESLTFSEFEKRYNLKFEPHPAWKGHIERG